MRWNLTAVNNNHLYLGHPKTKASRNWVSLAPRVVAALERQAALARASQPKGTPLEGLVFCRPDGSLLRPQGGAQPSSACRGAAVFPAGFGLMYGAGFALVFGLGLTVSVRSDIHLKAALSAALAVGLAGGAGAGAALQGFGAFAGLVAGLAGGALALAVAVHVGIALARRRGGGLPDQDEPGLPSPDSALHNDFVAGVVAGAITGIIAFVVAWRASWMSVPLPLAVVVGASAFLAAGPGFTSAVSRRYVALLLCTRGRLPWRLARFLRWARTAGIMRIASTAYQFRHDRLLQWLGR